MTASQFNTSVQALMTKFYLLVSEMYVQQLPSSSLGQVGSFANPASAVQTIRAQILADFKLAYTGPLSAQFQCDLTAWAELIGCFTAGYVPLNASANHQFAVLYPNSSTGVESVMSDGTLAGPQPVSPQSSQWWASYIPAQSNLYYSLSQVTGQPIYPPNGPQFRQNANIYAGTTRPQSWVPMIFTAAMVITPPSGGVRPAWCTAVPQSATSPTATVPNNQVAGGLPTVAPVQKAGTPAGGAPLAPAAAPIQVSPTVTEPPESQPGSEKKASQVSPTVVPVQTATGNSTAVFFYSHRSLRDGYSCAMTAKTFHRPFASPASRVVLDADDIRIACEIYIRGCGKYPADIEIREEQPREHETRAFLITEPVFV